MKKIIKSREARVKSEEPAEPVLYLGNGSGYRHCEAERSDNEAIQSTRTTGSVRNTGLPRSRWSLAMTPPVKAVSQRVSCLRFIKNAGFTMAEILLSLTIIGVVAAITLPSLTGNINERTWNTQRKALYARMSQAISLMPALGGFGSLTVDSDGNTTEDTATETFITNGLSKVLKINNICDSDHLGDCGIPSSITTLGGTKLSDVHTSLNHLTGLNYMFNGVCSGTGNFHPTYRQTDTKAAAFETANGESILAYYAPKCISEQPMRDNSYNFVQRYMCANFIYDLNGSKGPNTVGKDIGVITVFYPTDSVIAAPLLRSNTPLAASNGTRYSQINSLCSEAYGEEYRGPVKDDLGSIFINKQLFEIPTHYGKLISTTQVLNSSGTWSVWAVGTEYGGMQITDESNTGIGSVYCVKRN